MGWLLGTELDPPDCYWLPAAPVYYVYDGMRVIQERDGNNNPQVAYTRGKDLSGSLEGAGGIGGLLARSTWGGSSWSSHALYHADGNGNVTKLIDSSSEASVATYRYDPFGNTLSASDTLSPPNVYRFSSKEIHAASGMYYFLYRFYDPALQRWLSRDPLVEKGSLMLLHGGLLGRRSSGYAHSDRLDAYWDSNSYLYAGNRAVNAVDPDGRFFFLIVTGILIIAIIAAPLMNPYAQLPALPPQLPPPPSSNPPKMCQGPPPEDPDGPPNYPGGNPRNPWDWPPELRGPSDPRLPGDGEWTKPGDWWDPIE